MQTIETNVVVNSKSELKLCELTEFAQFRTSLMVTYAMRSFFSSSVKKILTHLLMSSDKIKGMATDFDFFTLHPEM